MSKPFIFYDKKVLLTGATGFIGRNTKDILMNYCEVYSPHRSELNLLNEKSVREYIQDNQINTIINLANPNPVKNLLDKQESMFEDSLRIFLNLYNSQDYYEMMYTLGSGAEYNKSIDIVQVTETEESRSIPFDSYGLSKYIINQLIKNSIKQCNLRIFGCYGPTDHESKFITHAIRCCINNQDITIRQDCYFDYLHVYDLGHIMGYFINHAPNYHSYNICTGTRFLLSEIAEIVKKEMNSDSNIVILKKGLNKEYTSSNRRLLEEIGEYHFISLEDGIKMQILSEREALGLI